MNLSYHSFYIFNFRSLFSKGTSLFAMSLQEKKIMAIALSTFGCFQACITIFNYLMKDKKVSLEKKSEIKIIPLPTEILKTPKRKKTEKVSFTTSTIKNDIRRLASHASSKEELIEIIEKEHCPDAFAFLARMMKMSGEKTVMVMGKEMTQEDLYLETIEDGDHADPLSYCNLAILLAKNKKIQLKNGKEMDRQALLLKAIELAPNNGRLFYNLSEMFFRGQKTILLPIELKDKEPLEKVDIYLKNKGMLVDKTDLYLLAIHYDSSLSLAYYDLAKRIDTKIELIDGTSMDKKELLVKCIELNPKYYRAYEKLAVILPETETIQLNGETATSEMLLELAEKKKKEKEGTA